MTKKIVVRNFGGWKWEEILSGKGKISEIFQKVKKIFENRGKSLNRGEMHHGVRGRWTPRLIMMVKVLKSGNSGGRQFQKDVVQWTLSTPVELKICENIIWARNIARSCWLEVWLRGRFAPLGFLTLFDIYQNEVIRVTNPCTESQILELRRRDVIQATLIHAYRYSMFENTLVSTIARWRKQ